MPIDTYPLMGSHKGMLERCGLPLVRAHDAAADYVRWRLDGSDVGLVFAVGVPLCWGVYWASGEGAEGMAWCRTLEAALQLLTRLGP